MVTKELLMYWWHWYMDGWKPNHVLETRHKEDEQFEQIIDKYGENRVMEVAMVSCLVSDGSPRIFLAAIRENAVEELFDSLPNISNLPISAIKKYRLLRNDFINELESKQQIDEQRK